jgi:peptidyl-prolyl cis-trans isomerase SurA
MPLFHLRTFAAAMQKLTFLLTLACWYCQVLPILAQDDPILFTVDNTGVSLSEFQYIYTKNNRDNADYSRASVTEYLDLYTRFKLKVTRARELQLDTITALRKELAGYRMQLAKSYLNDKEVVDKLTREAYDRMQWDIRAAHILIKAVPNATAEDIQRMEEKAQRAAQRAKAGEDFAALAKELSEDQNTAADGGELGFVTAMLPSGFYAVENAIYTLRDGEVSDPVHSSVGIHVLKVLGRRPARGEIEAAHIFVRVKSDGSNEEQARQKIFALYQNLKEGKNFEELATTVSDDQQTAKRGGYIGRFGINSYEPAFEDAAFNLVGPGAFSEPVRTRVGWHIIRLVNHLPPATYEEEKVRLEGRITRDERVGVAKAAMIETIRRESGMTEYPAARDAFVKALNEDFFTFQWTVPTSDPVVLIRFADGTQKTDYDFAQFLRTKTRERMRAAKTTTPQVVANNMYKEWVDELILSYEESRLEQKYPDFRALMREYEEGILLFEVTKTMVWDKASQDTAGLAAFHAMHREDYLWPERADVIHLTVEGPQAEKVTAKARKLLAKRSIENVVTKLNKKQQQVSFLRKRYTREEMTKEGLTWEEGWMSPVLADAETGNQKFTVVTTLLPPQPKALDEARGYVIADYQDHLEKEWVESLRQRYPVKVNEAVLNSIIRQ